MTLADCASPSAFALHSAPRWIPDAVRAVERTAQLLEHLGHHVYEAEPAVDGLAMAHDFCAIWFAQLAVEFEHARALLGASVSEFEPDTVAMASIAKARSAVSYAESYVRWTRYARLLSEFLARPRHVHDADSSASSAAHRGAHHARLADELMRAGMPLGLARLIPLFVAPSSKSSSTICDACLLRSSPTSPGCPPCPCPWPPSRAAFRLGVHFLANHGGEGCLFSLAGQLERAAPWHARRAVLGG